MSEANWTRIARTYLGLKEIKGPVDNPTIVAMFASCGHSWVKDDETAWCAAFVGHCLVKAGLKSSGALTAKSYLDHGTVLTGPVADCIGVKNRMGGAAWQGHTGFVVAANRSTIWLLGGNQNNMVSIAPFKRSEFAGFIWPEGAARPKVPRPLPTSAEGALGGSEA